MITKTYTVTCNGESVLRRVDRLMAWLDRASRAGHSGVVAVSLDGDGQERCLVSPLDPDSKKHVTRLNGKSREMRVEYLNSDTKELPKLNWEV